MFQAILGNCQTIGHDTYYIKSVLESGDRRFICFVLFDMIGRTEGVVLALAEKLADYYDLKEQAELDGPEGQRARNKLKAMGWYLVPEVLLSVVPVGKIKTIENLDDLSDSARAIRVLDEIRDYSWLILLLIYISDKLDFGKS
ncbi:MAG: hypothetical protein KDK27_04305 [Leptospiraceae bacterium]|nr:hypothetical protein [Leptospiraceae bacterium]